MTGKTLKAIDDKEKRQIVRLAAVHKLSDSIIAKRLGRDVKRIAKIREAAGVPHNKANMWAG